MLMRGELHESDRRLPVHNPWNGELVDTVSMDSPADVEAAIAAVAAYDHRLEPGERGRILRAAAAALETRGEELARGITLESGVPIKAARKEIARSRGNLLVAAEEAERLHGEALRITGAGGAKLCPTLLEPVGVVCAITPFNRPLNQVVVKLAPAIAANNGVVLKPSEKTPLTALAFARLLLDCGLPEDMLSVVTGDPAEISDALLTSPRVDMVTFTGGVEAGEAIARRVGLKKIAMELGGNDPLFVLADADLDAAVRLAVAGAYSTAGQSCRGVKRVLVADEVADDFVPRLVEASRQVQVGDPFDDDTVVACLISEEAARRVEERCGAAVADGAELLLGGGRRGSVVPPTVLDRVSPASDLVVHETFGPVAPVLRFTDLDEAVQIANGTIYGLQAGVVTRDLAAFMSLARRLRVGAVNLMEGPQFGSPHIPFGGVKKSGIGREGIAYAMREMSTVKTLVLPW